MDSSIDSEILLYNQCEWLALEREYWTALLRLIRVYGLDPHSYSAPAPHHVRFINSAASARLVECLTNAMEDVPGVDLWHIYGNTPDPATTPPHEFFSGCGVSYLEALIDFVAPRAFSIEVTEPGTEYRFLGPMENHPGR